MNAQHSEHRMQLMLDEDAEVIAREIHKQHVTVATISGVISGVAHVVLLLFVLFVPLDLTFVPDSQAPDEASRKHVNIQEISRESWIETMREAGVPSAVAFPAPRLAESVEALEAPAASDALEPPPLASDAPAFNGPALREPSTDLEPGEWQPRQELLAVTESVVVKELPGLERKALPKIARIPNASDVVLPVLPGDFTGKAGRIAVEGPISSIIGLTPDGGDAESHDGDMVPAEVDNTQGGDVTAPVAAEVVKIDEPLVDSPQTQFEEDSDEITPLKPLDNLLKSNLQLYYDRKEAGYGYFRLAIDRIDKGVLPTIPKDILLIQDTSASIAEQRLYFCRAGLNKMLDGIQPQDRFNMVRFRDTAEFCFKDWVSPTPDMIKSARTFIEGMRSEGETDILNSLKPISQVTHTPGRPIVTLLVTDGLATTGITRSTDIIGEFSKLNDGRISVFTMGTMTKANTYLLDLLSYCNRGDSRLTIGGRWGIPDVMGSLMQELSAPVLEDVTFRFAQESPCEVYPWLTMNLYSDRSLVMYGKFPRDMESFTFQAQGRAGDILCDMIFTLNIREGQFLDDKSIRDTWAKQKIYTLIGEYARTQNPAALSEMDRTASYYRIKIPYRKRF